VKKPTTVEELLVAQSELMKDMFIADLAIAGVPQLEIAKVVRVNLNRVNRIAKFLKKRKKAPSSGE
jgi:3-methyladenine DNA glycosylase AlkD